LGRLLYGDITEKIIGAAFTVHKALGKNLSEIAYRNALVVQLRLLNLKVEVEKELPLSFVNIGIGVQRADLLVADKIIVETKAIHRIHSDHLDKLLATLRNTGYQLGLVVNFSKSVHVKRVINTVQHK
jgi:GxxExxY protein